VSHRNAPLSIEGPATARPTSPGSSAPGPGTRGPDRSPLATTARWSGTSGSWPRSCSTLANTPARTNGRRRSPCGTSTTTTIGPTAPRAASHPLPDCAPASPTSGPHTVGTGPDIVGGESRGRLPAIGSGPTPTVSGGAAVSGARALVAGYHGFRRGEGAVEARTPTGSGTRTCAVE
jgi:hypothetical protein